MIHCYVVKGGFNLLLSPSRCQGKKKTCLNHKMMKELQRRRALMIGFRSLAHGMQNGTIRLFTMSPPWVELVCWAFLMPCQSLDGKLFSFSSWSSKRFLLNAWVFHTIVCFFWDEECIYLLHEFHWLIMCFRDTSLHRLIIAILCRFI